MLWRIGHLKLFEQHQFYLKYTSLARGLMVGTIGIAYTYADCR